MSTPLLPYPLCSFQNSAPLGRRMFTVAAEKMEGDNWDLGAVVRSCRPSGEAAASAAVLAFPPFLAVEAGKGGAFMCISEAFRKHSGFLEMEEISKSSDPKVHPPPEKESVSWPPSNSFCRKVDRSTSQTPLSRRKKKQKKKKKKKVVHQVAAAGFSSDIYAWRKYGQKPIKGSPYPRGYYRCSSSKGCAARKQVERSRTDSTVFIITYTGEHSHPMPTKCNSPSGSTTRPKIPRSPSGSNQEASPLSSTTTTAFLSASILTRPNEVFTVEEEEEDGQLLVEDMEIMGEDDLLFVNLEEGATASPAAEMAATILDGEGNLDHHLLPLLWRPRSV